MLDLQNICAGYDDTEILFDLSMQVERGEFVTLLGRNGMGKTTTVRSIMGLVPPKRGQVRFQGEQIKGRPPYIISRRGIGLVPEGRGICPNLTVLENLTATARGRGDWTIESVQALFPILESRLHHYGNELSGGEQQLIAIARALLTNPKLLILDEATEGLAPLMRAEVWKCLSVLRKKGQSVLIIDKNIKVLSEIADRHYVIEKGKIVWSGDAKEFRENRSSIEVFLGV